MIPFEHALCRGEIRRILRNAVKRQRQHRVEVILLQGKFLCPLRQMPEPQSLPAKRLLHLVPGGQRVNLFRIGFYIVRGACILPEFLFDDAKLLPQHEFALAPVETHAKLLLILMAHPHDIDFAREFTGQNLVKLIARIALEQALPRAPGPGELRRAVPEKLHESGLRDEPRKVLLRKGLVLPRVELQITLQRAEHGFFLLAVLLDFPKRRVI